MPTDNLTDHQKETIDLYTDSYRDSTAKEKKIVLKNLVDALFPKQANSTQEEKDMRFGLIKAIKPAMMLYLGNHARRRKPKIHVSYIRAWSLPQVVGHEKKAEVEQLCREQSGHPPGSKPYFGMYQRVLSDFVKTLSAEDRQKYQDMAKEWTERSPPVEIQQKMAEKHAHNYVKQFAQQMWMQLGLKVFILSAHKDSLGTIDIADHDFNDELGGRAFADVRPNWMEKPILGEWSRYAEAELDPDHDRSSSDDEVVKRTKKRVPITLDKAEDGTPLLPDAVAEGVMSYDKLHPFVREYLNCHYRLASGFPKASVPWNDVVRNQKAFIDDQYLPFGFELKEPSKMNKREVEALLTYWHKRQRNPGVAMPFRFKAHKDRSTGDVVDAKYEGGTVKKSNTSRARARGKKGTKEAKESGEGSDTEGDTDPLPEPARRGRPNNNSSAPEIVRVAGSDAASGSYMANGAKRGPAASDSEEGSDQSESEMAIQARKQLYIARRRKDATAPVRRTDRRHDRNGYNADGTALGVSDKDCGQSDRDHMEVNRAKNPKVVGKAAKQGGRKRPAQSAMSEDGPQAKKIRTRSDRVDGRDIPVTTRAAAQRAAKKSKM